MVCKMMVSVIIPAWNEEKTIANTVARARKAFPEGEVIVIDNASKDETEANAKQAGALVLRESKKGKGHALKKGLAKASGEILVFLDADIRNLSPSMLKRLVRPVMNGECEAVIGTFSSPFPQTLTEFAYKPLVGSAFPEVAKAIPDSPLSGQRALTKGLARKTRFLNGFGVEVGMNIDWVQNKTRIKMIQLGSIKPVFKGTLGPREMKKRAHEIIKAVLLKAKQYKRVKKLNEARLKAVYERVSYVL